MTPQQIYDRSRYNADLDLENGQMPKPNRIRETVATQTELEPAIETVSYSSNEHALIRRFNGGPSSTVAQEMLSLTYHPGRDTRTHEQIIVDRLQTGGNKEQLLHTLAQGLREVHSTLGVMTQDTTNSYNLHQNLEALQAYVTDREVGYDNPIRIRNNRDRDTVIANIERLLPLVREQFKRGKIRKLADVFPPRGGNN